ncbi:hypothetical protein [Cerasicoccus maritimus]|uniref:hypothetical protein n=1 Tax=Cerasicoccus maritimus TaxID=490089 RepID=UPI002852986F|nr:hypothetical protein [Cerasicoccus maritimus]
MNRKQQDVIEYLLEENRVLKQQFDATGKKLDLNDCQRRSLAEKAKKLGKDQLEKYANLVTPKTLLAWHRRGGCKVTAHSMNKLIDSLLRNSTKCCLEDASTNDSGNFSWLDEPKTTGCH